MNSIGTCECCGRQQVEVRWSVHPSRKMGRHLVVCVDDHACFATWRGHLTPKHALSDGCIAEHSPAINTACEMRPA